MALVSMVSKLSYWKKNAKQGDEMVYADPIWNEQHYKWFETEAERQYTCLGTDQMFENASYTFKAPFDRYLCLSGWYVTRSENSTTRDELKEFVLGHSFTREFEVIKRIRATRRLVYWAMIRASVKFLSLQKRASVRVNHTEAKRKRSEFETIDEM
jgi:hypothetical protein